jgi:transposase
VSTLNISQSCVQRSLKRIAELGSYSSRRRSGRPRITTAHGDRIIRRMSVAHPMASSSWIQAHLPESVSASRTTIKRRLHDELGLKAYRPAKKPSLSPKNVRDRLEFCRRHRHWTTDEWSKVLFSDETCVRQFSNYVPLVRRPPGQRYNRRYIVPVVKHSPSVMLWSCISAHGTGPLWVMPQIQRLMHASISQFYNSICRLL